MRFALLVSAFSILAFGQGNTSSILGTVADSSGAVVAGVKIVVVNTGTGVQATANTDSLGNYTFNLLQPGTYTVEAEISGFKKFVRQGIGLEMTRQLRIDISLEPGAVTETVNVAATTPLLETETGQLSTTIENEQVTKLPTLNRDPQSFRLLSPGVVQNRGGDVITQGGQVRKDPYYIDGAHSSNHVWSGTPVNPNPDVIQEFKVLTNSFSAEYGETSGAVMSSTTKSGTNEFHGTLFEFLRNDKMNGGNFFTHARPIIRRNQYGGTVGGPIIKNKTFFFFDIQFTKQRGTSVFNNLSVPSPAFKSGDFSSILGGVIGTDALGRSVSTNQIFDPATTRTIAVNGQNVTIRDPFAGNVIPTNRMSPAALKIQSLFPNPQTSANFANYSSAGAIKDENYEYDIKIDHNFSDKDKIMGRFSLRKTDNTPAQPFPDPNAGGGVPGVLGQALYTRNKAYQGVLNHVHIFSPRLTNDLHLGWFQTYPHRPVPGDGQISTNSLGIMGLPNGNVPMGTPDFGWTNFARLGASSDTLFYELQNSKSIVDVASFITGRHSIRFGGEARQIRTDNLQPNPGTTLWRFQPLFTDQRGFAGSGFDYASFLLGLPQDMQYKIYPGFFNSRASVYALFVQDDIRVNRKLTINLGLRWDAPLFYHEAQNRSGVFDLNQGQYIQFGTNGFRNTPWNNNWKNFGPRIGFAYSPVERTVIRGGYGIFYVGTMSSGANGFMQTDPIFADSDVGRYRTADNVTPRTTLDLIPYSPADKTGRNASSVSIYPDNNPMSYMQQWNLNIQREIARIMVEVGYTGSKGTHLGYGTYNLNAIPLNLAQQAQGQKIAPYVPYPQYPLGVNVQSWIGSSNYNSLQVKAERRFAAGLGFLAAFTWQKLINVGEQGWRDPLNNRSLDRGISPDSSPYRFTVGYSYQLPFGRGNKWLNNNGVVDAFLGGWEINGITTVQGGFPLSPVTATDICNCGNSVNRPNVSGNPNIDGSARTLDKWFDTSVFSNPAANTIGNAGRGLIWGPGLINWDAEIGKRFLVPKISEAANLQFRAEFYNLTNTPYFNNPNITVGSANFGRITDVSNSPRQMQMALKFVW